MCEGNTSELLLLARGGGKIPILIFKWGNCASNLDAAAKVQDIRAHTIANYIIIVIGNLIVYRFKRNIAEPVDK